MIITLKKGTTKKSIKKLLDRVSKEMRQNSVGCRNNTAERSN